jgi:hypothetical protein
MEPYSSSKIAKQDHGGGTPETAKGQWASHMNSRILNSAYDAAIVYYFTGEKKYAKFAADIFWTFCLGASYQEQIEPKEEFNMHGFFCWETIRDSQYYAQIPLIYDFIHDYLVKDYFESAEFKNGRNGQKWAPGFNQGKDWALGRIHLFFQKYMDNKLTRGGGLEGNWNTNEHRSGMLYALAIDDDEQVKENHRGREYYVTQFLLKTTKSNGAYLDLPKANLSPKTGLWPEAPAGYGQGSIAQLIQFGFWYYQNGIDVLGSEPLIRKAGMSFPQVAFPNGCAVGWGDGGHNTMMVGTAEYMIAYARAHGDADMENTFTTMLNLTGEREPRGDEALFFFVPELTKVKAKAPFPRVSYSETHSLIFERSIAEKPEDSLAYTVYGNGGHSGHKHNNGMAMELYGRGHILGIDPGAGPDYWCEQHHQYNMQVSTHNTVVANGKGVPGNVDLIIENAEPEVVAGVDPEKQASPLYQFTDTSIDLKHVQQRRVMGIVRTSPQAGFYVDIFRSKAKGEGDNQHDYLYHNMGKGLDLYDANDSPLKLTDQKLDVDSGPGYKYLATEDHGSVSWPGDFYGNFSFGVDGIVMKMWMLGQKGRTLHSLGATPNFRYYLGQFKTLTVPTLLVRQKGEAWMRPFVAIYEPFGNGIESSIKRVRRMKDAPECGDFVGIAVEHNDEMKRRTDFILNATDAGRQQGFEGVTFQGIYGIVTIDPAGFKGMYLGAGHSIAYGHHALRAAGALTSSLTSGIPAPTVVSASLIYEGRPLGGRNSATGYVYSSDGDVLVRFPYDNFSRSTPGQLSVSIETDQGTYPATLVLAESVDGATVLTAHLPAATNARIHVSLDGNLPFN